MRAGELGHWLADPGRRFQVLGEEHLGSLPAPHHHRVPQGAAEEQVVGGAVLHADAHTGAVHVGHGGQRGPVGHRVHALDQHVRRGEGHLASPGGLDPQETDVGPSRQQRRERVARSAEADELQSDAESGCDLAPDIDRYARRRGGCPLSKHRVAQVDGGPQHPARRKIAGDAPSPVTHASRISARRPEARHRQRLLRPLDRLLLVVRMISVAEGSSRLLNVTGVAGDVVCPCRRPSRWGLAKTMRNGFPC